MNKIHRNFSLVLLAIAGFLLWNYPLTGTLNASRSVWMKMLYFFGSWLLIVLITRKIVKSNTPE